MGTARIGVVQFPGTNCELDVAHALRQLGANAEILWHARTDLGSNGGVDAVVIPGGFAHGDYLRSGAIARFSPIMAAITKFAEAGGPVIGICNGFQILTETNLLPGALRKNEGQKFVCGSQVLRVASTNNVLASELAVGDQIQLPINHFEGNYTCDRQQLDAMWEAGQVFATYVGNPNGSVDDIAGVSNKPGNVVGLMPHPERASSALLGTEDGNRLFGGLLKAAS